MAYEQKDGQGSLFRNKRKEKETHPDYNGSFKIGGVEYWLSGWMKEAKSGEQYMSLSVKPKETRQDPPAATAEPKDFNDPLPF